MTRILSDGFGGQDLSYKWVTSGGPVASTTNARIEGYCCYFAVAGTGYIQRTITALSSLFFRMSYYYAAGTPSYIIGFYASATQLAYFSKNTSTNVMEAYVNGVKVATGSTVLLSATQYVVSGWYSVADSGGRMVLKINGVTDIDYTGDTKPGTDTTINIFRVTCALGSSTQNTSIDDMALNDSAGSAPDNTYPVDAHIYTLLPNGNGDSSQLTGSDGNSTDNYLLVNEAVPDNDSTYVESATSGQNDLYAMANLPTLPSGSTIIAVQVEAIARELTAAGDQINLGVKSGATTSWASGQATGTGYGVFSSRFATDPDTSAAWTESGVNAMQAGVKVT